MIARSPRCEDTGARRPTTVATANDLAIPRPARPASAKKSLARRWSCRELVADVARTSALISLVACASSTRPPTAATGRALRPTPFQFNVVDPSPASDDVRAGRQVDELPNPPPETLMSMCACCLVGWSSTLNLKLPRTGPTATRTVGSKCVASTTSMSRDVGQALTDLVRVGDERPDGVRPGGNLAPGRCSRAAMRAPLPASPARRGSPRHTLSRVSGMSICRTPSGDKRVDHRVDERRRAADVGALAHALGANRMVRARA